MKLKYFIIGFTLLFFIGCAHEDIYYRLDHSRWFLYSEGDTLIFRNNDTLIDTYIISDIWNYFDETGDRQDTHYEHLRVTFEGVTECTNCPIYGFSRSSTNVGFTGNLYQQNFSYDDPTIEYTLGDTILQDIYVMEDIPIEDTARHKVKAIYYSDIFGIIRYDMYDDRVYELQIE
ncbi:MAG: hypothetical protein JXB24_01495 [Bacteroidales bacterium]|nr:hypothetical protein [Bacteroidales bacterium]